MALSVAEYGGEHDHRVHDDEGRIQGLVLAGVPTRLAPFAHLVGFGGRPLELAPRASARVANEILGEGARLVLRQAAVTQHVEHLGPPADASTLLGFCHGVYLLPYSRTPDE
jgi:hypothetical protein